MKLGILKDEFIYESSCTGREIRLFHIAPGQGTDMLRILMRYQNLKPSSLAGKIAVAFGDWLSFWLTLLNDPASLLSYNSTMNEKHMPYTAISYAWGDPDDRVLVSCNGSKMGITRSLHGALWRLRQKGYKGQVWADAICINQQDLTEKSEQIRMMGDIYQQAERVFIWLGGEEENDEMGLRLMQSINTLLERDGPAVTGRPTPDLGPNGLGFTELPPAWWHGLLSIMQRSWFWRAWTVQEYLRARNRVFQCGKFEVPATLISGAFHRIGEHHELKYLATALSDDEPKINASSSLLGPLFNFDGMPLGRLPLTKLLSRARGLRSSDPKDRLFALVDLSNDTATSFIDYHRDFGDLLREMTRKEFHAILSSPDPSELFRYLSLVSKNDCAEGRSSWAPFHEQGPQFCSFDSLFTLEAHLETVPEVDFTDSKALRLKGRIFDCVQKIPINTVMSELAAKVDKKNPERAMDQLRRVLSFYNKVWDLLSGIEPYVTGESIKEVFWRSLIFNTQEKHLKASPQMAECLQSNRESIALTLLWSEYQTGFRDSRDSPRTIFREARDLVPNLRWNPSLELRDDCQQSLLVSMREYVNLKHESTGLWANAMVLLSWGRQYFASQLGYAGWVPDHAQEGDLICHFHGSRFPFVIRQHQEGFKLIGACYMHGLMEGEAIHLPCKDGHDESYICLV